MKHFSLIYCLVSIFITTSSFADIPNSITRPIQELLQKGLKDDKYVGLSIAIINKKGDSFEAHFGYRDIENKLKPDSNTIYEIGSITKPFTRLTLASQTQIRLNDPIEKFLPKHIRAPRPQGKNILIRDLVTHTGIKFSVPCTVRANKPNSLKCFGFDLDPNLTNPYKLTTREKLYAFLNEYSYTVDEFPHSFASPGYFYSYSNNGYGLLGELIAENNNTDFENYLKKTILAPLNMTNTLIRMPCEENNSCKNMARVYSKNDERSIWNERSLWQMPGMNGAGGLRSTLNDMKKFLVANLTPETTKIPNILTKGQSPLHDASKLHNSNLCQESKNPIPKNCNPTKKSFYYAWEEANGKAFYHGGGTGASQAMILFSKDRSLGVVILSNSKAGKGEKTLYHYPNDVSLCAFQLAGNPIVERDFCKRLTNQ